MPRFIGESLALLSDPHADPRDREIAEEELRVATFGAGYKTDRNGEPVDTGRGSDAFYVSDATPPANKIEADRLRSRIKDSFRAHIDALRRSGPTGMVNPHKGERFDEAADLEARRINQMRERVGLPAL